MDEELRTELLDACDTFLATEPSNFTASVDSADLDTEGAAEAIKALRTRDTAPARRLRRALEDYQQAARRFRSAAVTLDSVEARVRDSFAELAADLRKEDSGGPS